MQKAEEERKAALARSALADALYDNRMSEEAKSEKSEEPKSSPSAPSGPNG